MRDGAWGSRPWGRTCRDLGPREEACWGQTTVLMPQGYKTILEETWEALPGVGDN